MTARPNWPKPLLALVERSLGREALECARDYVPSEAEFDVLAEMARGMLAACDPVGSSCVAMSALLSQCLSHELGTCVPVVAGALKLSGHYMYGGDRGFDGSTFFSESSDEWDGHCWVLFGDYIVDVSLGRTARSGDCRAPLAEAVIKAFGENVGLIALTENGAREAALRYLPRYVLTPDQALALAGGAIQTFGL